MYRKLLPGFMLLSGIAAADCINAPQASLDAAKLGGNAVTIVLGWPQNTVFTNVTVSPLGDGRTQVCGSPQLPTYNAEGPTIMPPSAPPADSLVDLPLVGSHVVPEIDPRYGSAGLALAAGIVLVLKGAKKREE